MPNSRPPTWPRRHSGSRHLSATEAVAQHGQAAQARNGKGGRLGDPGEDILTCDWGPLIVCEANCIPARIEGHSLIKAERAVLLDITRSPIPGCGQHVIRNRSRGCKESRSQESGRHAAAICRKAILAIDVALGIRADVVNDFPNRQLDARSNLIRGAVYACGIGAVLDNPGCALQGSDRGGDLIERILLRVGSSRGNAIDHRGKTVLVQEFGNLDAERLGDCRIPGRDGGVRG